MHSVIDEIIGEARAKGEFDNLRGSGKPLHLKQNHYAGDDALANEMLVKAGYKPAWLEEREEIEESAETARRNLYRAWQLHRCYPSSAWRQAVEQFDREIDTLNRRIRHFNIKAPHQNFQLLTIDAQIERRKVEGKR